MNATPLTSAAIDMASERAAWLAWYSREYTSFIPLGDDGYPLNLDTLLSLNTWLASARRRAAAPVESIDTPAFWALANAWASSTIDTPQRAAALVAHIDATKLVAAVPAGFKREELEDILSGLETDPQTVDVGEALLESTSGYLCRMLRVMLGKPVPSTQA